MTISSHRNSVGSDVLGLKVALEPPKRPLRAASEALLGLRQLGLRQDHLQQPVGGRSSNSEHLGMALKGELAIVSQSISVSQSFLQRLGM